MLDSGRAGKHTVLLGVGQVKTKVVQMLQDLLQSQLGQLAAGASQAAGKSGEPDSELDVRTPGVQDTLPNQGPS